MYLDRLHKWYDGRSNIEEKELKEWEKRPKKNKRRGSDKKRGKKKRQKRGEGEERWKEEKNWMRRWKIEQESDNQRGNKSGGWSAFFLEYTVRKMIEMLALNLAQNSATVLSWKRWLRQIDKNQLTAEEFNLNLLLSRISGLRWFYITVMTVYMTYHGAD